MRAQSSNFQPVITLTIPGVQTVSTGLPFPSSKSWQWVSAMMLSNQTANSTLTVTLTTSPDSQASGTAYFDDLCISIISK